MPPKLTMAAAERLIQRDHPGLWEKMTPQERREAVHKFNADRNEKPSRPKPKVDTDAFTRRQFAGTLPKRRR